MPKLLKKLLVSALLASQIFATSLLTLTPQINAQETQEWYNPSFQQFAIKVFGGDQTEIFGERYTYAQVLWIEHSLTAIALGDDLSKCLLVRADPSLFEKCLNIAKVGSSSSPILALAAISDSFLETRPASGIQYVADSASKFHLVPEAQAQGFGFQTLRPIQTLWRVSRNASYLLLIIAFIVLAFMIMFRVKISPQAVVTIQSSLPKIALTLILITFSYAIAGFIIDLAYVLIGLLALVIKNAGGTETISQLRIDQLFLQLGGLGRPIFSLFLVLALFLLVILAVFSVAAAGVSGFFTGGGSIFLIAAANGFIILILAVFFIFIAFRILWLLLKTFISILLLIIGGPFLILAGVLPNAGGFRGWIRNLAANVAVYPTVILMIFLSHFFFWSFFPKSLSGSVIVAGQEIIESIPGNPGFNPYLINSGTIDESTAISLPGFGASGGIAGFVIALGLLTLTPSAGNIIKSVLRGRPFDLETGIKQAFGPSRGFGLGGVQYTATEIEKAEQEAFLKRYPNVRQAPPNTTAQILRRFGLIR